VDDELDALLNFGQFFGQRGLAELDAGSGFVDQVDGLIGKKTVGNITVRMRDGKIDGVVGVGDGVEFFVAFFYAKENLDGVDFVGRRNLYGLEAALERAIFFDGLAVFGGGSCADALNFSARKGGLEDVGGISEPSALPAPTRV